MTKKVLSGLVAVAALASAGNAEEWKNSFDLGATVTTGNSDTVLLTLGFATEKIEKTDEYRGNFSYTYGKDSDETTNDEILSSASWRHLFSEKTYAGPRFDFRRDSVADIDYRASLSGVYGYFLVKDEKTSFSIEGGPGVTFEKTGGETDQYIHAYAGEFFEHQFNDKTKIFQSLTMLVPLDDTGDYQVVAELGLETSLSDTLSLKIFAQNKFDAQPASGSDSNDFRLVTGISYKF